MSKYEKGQKVICIETSILDFPGYLSESKVVTDHRDVILSEKTILRSAKRNEGKKRIFVPQLIIDRVITSLSGEIFLSFTNGQRTPPKYRLHHIHPASRFRFVEDEERN